jgi:HlyD family secretion protein
MDIARPEFAKKRRKKRIIYSLAVILAVVAVTLGLSQLEPAAPVVSANTVYTDIVKRGEMLRQVRGLGTLVPEEIRWIPAVTQGVVERILLRPGAEVRPDSVILILSNPELERQVLDAELQLKAAEAQFENLKVQLESQLLTQRAAAATIQAEYRQAKMQVEVDEQLAKEGLISELNLKQSRVRAEELAVRQELEAKRLAIAMQAVESQLEVQRAAVEQQRALYIQRKRELDQLRVRPGMQGVLQQVAVEVGQQVTPGTNLARVADLSRLKAEIRIPETQAKDVVVGQKAVIDTRNGIVPGRVSRVDPAVREGTVLVDVALEGPLPQGARPDLSIDGTIEIERLTDVLYVGRPVHGQPNSTISLFKLLPNSNEAVRVQVRLGRSSVNTMEILEGLQEGDRVILSDMSAHDAYDRIRLN